MLYNQVDNKIIELVLCITSIPFVYGYNKEVFSSLYNDENQGTFFLKEIKCWFYDLFMCIVFYICKCVFVYVYRYVNVYVSVYVYSVCDYV